MSYIFQTVGRCLSNVLRRPRKTLHRVAGSQEETRGSRLAKNWQPDDRSSDRDNVDSGNRLERYFDANTDGPGIWKWRHYFEIYDRHLRKFVDRAPTLVEVGVYSGGSLGMWHDYFGEGCQIHGIDIQEECRAYEAEYTTIHIGDQADRRFWHEFRNKVPQVDILIDDGGHEAEQQMVTLEEMLSHLKPGGVFICEDVHGTGNGFATFAQTLADELNAFSQATIENSLASRVTQFQASIHSVHVYPFMIVIEKHTAPQPHLIAPKQGTQWQPFL